MDCPNLSQDLLETIRNLSKNPLFLLVWRKGLRKFIYKSEINIKENVVKNVVNFWILSFILKHIYLLHLTIQFTYTFLYFFKNMILRSSVICTFSLSFHFCYFCYMYVLDICNFKASINNQNIYFQKFSCVFWFHRSERKFSYTSQNIPITHKTIFYLLFLLSVYLFPPYKIKITIKLGRPFPTRSTTIDKSWRKTIFQLW